MADWLCGPRGYQFQSTPPARGATQLLGPLVLFHADFNPRPPRGGRRQDDNAAKHPTHISIHAPPRGGRLDHHHSPFPNLYSIHAPREGGDSVLIGRADGNLFQSTPPARGATSPAPWHPRPDGDFNPRPPRGGRHDGTPYIIHATIISIHAPREGGD